MQRRGFIARRGFILRRALLATVCALPLAVLIALLSTGVMSKGMLFDAGRWVAWAVFATWTDGSGFMYPTTTTNNVVIGASTESGSDIRLNDGGVMIVNEQGNNSDCRIEGDTDQNLIYTDAGADNVGIGTSSPGCKLTVVKSGTLPVLSATTVLAVQNSANAGDDCSASILCDNTGGAALTFGYTDTPANTQVASLTADMSTGELAISADTTKFDSGQKVKRTAVSGTYTVLTTDYYVGIDVGSNRAITLPSAASAGVGRMYIFATETGGNTATISAAGSDTIEGAGSFPLAGSVHTTCLLCIDDTSNGKWIKLYTR